MGEACDKSCVDQISEAVIQLSPPGTASVSRTANRTVTQHTFKKVYSPECGQKEVFNQLALPLVHDLLHGKNGLLFAYGITNSGKTHTMTGPADDNGILPRILDVIFNSIGDLLSKPFVFRPDKSNWFSVHTDSNAKVFQEQLKKKSKKKSKNKSCDESQPGDASPDSSREADQSLVQGIVEDNNYSVFISYFEIYNNYVYDLLEDPSETPQSLLLLRAHRGPQAKNMREDTRHNLYVGGGTEIAARTANEAYALLGRGQKVRRQSHTNLNHTSSRSHAVFNIRLVQAPLDPSGEQVLQEANRVSVSQLSLVDLAGSERTSRTKSGGAVLREAGSINSSLMVLRNCIETLRDNQLQGANKLVPYRDSKLTHLFKNFFEGEGKVRMIICLNPRSQDYEEMTYVMKFSELTQSVCVERSEAPKQDPALSVGRRRANIIYKASLQQLEEERRMKEAQEEALDTLDLAIGGRKHVVSSALPPLSLDMDRYLLRELSFQEFVKVLRERCGAKSRVREEVARKQAAFRQLLIEVEEERDQLRLSNTKYKAELDGREGEVKLIQERVKLLQRRNDQLQKTVDTYLQTKKNLESDVQTAEQQLEEERDRGARVRSMIQDILYHEKAKWESKIRLKVVRSEEELLLIIREKETVLEELKNLIEDEQISSRPNSFYMIPSPCTKRNGIGDFPRNPEGQCFNTVSKATKIPFHAKARKKTLLSPPSTSELNNIPKVFDHYILPHQEPAVDGNVLTQVYRGDVTRTKGGGTAVQLTEVETLPTQEKTKIKDMPRFILGKKATYIPKLSERPKPSGIPISTSGNRLNKASPFHPRT